ncbi:hypothetical protein L210DRAFT_1060307, partial [Boletus edulis BED1]
LKRHLCTLLPHAHFAIQIRLAEDPSFQLSQVFLAVDESNLCVRIAPRVAPAEFTVQLSFVHKLRRFWLTL